MINTPSILSENEKRKAVLFAFYDPISGVGSPVPRIRFPYDNGIIHLIPEAMGEVALIQDIARAGGITNYCKSLTGGQLTQDLYYSTNFKYIQIRCKYDLEYWAATQYHIKDKKSGGDTLFVFNRPQRECVREIYDDLFVKQDPVRFVVLKSRQWGSSTFFVAVSTWIQTFWKEGWSSVICADLKDKAKHIRGMLSYMAIRHDTNIAKITLKPYQQSQEHKEYAERNCMIGVGSVENPLAFNAYSFYMAIMSEIGLWRKTANTNPKELAQSISSVVPNLPFTMIIKESTARGVGTLFHDEWIKAESGVSGYKGIFIPWFFDEKNVLPIGNLEQFIKTMTPHDWEMWECGATLEGINWYNTHKRTENFDDVGMGENFPTTPQEAFMSSGRRAFSPAYVARARKTCCDPIFIGDVYGDSMKGKEALNNLRLDASPNGELRVWVMPPKDVEYSNRFAVSVDVGGRHNLADFSIIKVFDRQYQSVGGSPEVVAVWCGHLDQDLMSWKAAQIGKLYGTALIAVEVNSLDQDEESEGDHSLTVLDEISKYYDNLYARIDPEKVKLGAPVLYGFHNNKKTRPMIIDELNAALRDSGYIERDSRACDEMDWFVMNNKGKYEAAEGKHDDHVMTTAIGVWLCNSYMDMPKKIVKHTGGMSKKTVSEATM